MNSEQVLPNLELDLVNVVISTSTSSIPTKKQKVYCTIYKISWSFQTQFYHHYIRIDSLQLEIKK